MTRFELATHGDERSGVCVPAAVLTDMQARYPSVNLLPISFSGSIGEAMLESECEAVVWSMPVVMRVPETAATFCAANLYAAEPVLDIPWAFPARDSLGAS